jgi:hypothetical protein
MATNRGCFSSIFQIRFFKGWQMSKLPNFIKTFMISVMLLIGSSIIAWGEGLSLAEKDGLLVPLQATQYNLGSKLFMKVAHFDVNTPMDEVVAVYSSEFLKRGWKVDPAQASEDHKIVHFATPQGRGTLDVINSGYSIVELSLTDELAAAKSPLAPKAGMVTVLFINETKKAVAVSLGGKRVKVAAGANSPFKKETGLEIEPGKLQAKTKKGNTDFEAEAGQIWIVEISDFAVLSSKQN